MMRERTFRLSRPKKSVPIVSLGRFYEIDFKRGASPEFRHKEKIKTDDILSIDDQEECTPPKDEDAPNMSS